MRRSTQSFLVCVILLVEAGCAGSPAAPVFATSSSAPVVEDTALPMVYNGVVGVFMSEDMVSNVLAGVEYEKGEARVTVARKDAELKMTNARLDAVVKGASNLEWRATYGPWLGFGGGLTAAAIAIICGFFLARALPAQ